MSDKIGLFTGSFDPITKGHIDLIERASKLFDCLYVGIFYNLEKKSFFSIEAKEKMVTAALAHLENVKIVTSHDELAVEVARKLGVTTFVRGLRNSQDLDYEGNLNFFNHELAPFPADRQGSPRRCPWTRRCHRGRWRRARPSDPPYPQRGRYVSRRA